MTSNVLRVRVGLIYICDIYISYISHIYYIKYIYQYTHIRYIMGNIRYYMYTRERYISDLITDLNQVIVVKVE